MVYCVFVNAAIASFAFIDGKPKIKTVVSEGKRYQIY
jgi:hypothetical protein